MIDIHTHILPGVNDGSKTMQDSIQMLKQAIDAGIKFICATPHVLNDVNPTLQDKINHTFQLLCSQVAERNLKTKLILSTVIETRLLLFARNDAHSSFSTA